MKKAVDVLLPLPIDQLFSYAVEEDTEVSIGDYVVVPFGRKRLIGIVWKYSGKSDRELKCIEQKIELPSIRPKLIEFAEWVAQYNVIPIGMLAKVIMGGVLKVNQIDKLVFTKQKQEISEIDYQLSPEQQAARDKIISNLNEYSVTLLDGETGSGKTEVYLSVIARLIEIVNDAQVLILLPEIVLTSQLVNRVHSQISGNIAEWHSGLTPKARRNNWLNIANGSAQIIIGARSSLFLPYKNLKLIIVDEEHDSSFKQEQGIIYNARDMAIILAKLENIPIILSSATPLLETIYHVKKGNYNHVKLTERFGGAELPHIKVVNNKQWISNELFEGIKQTIEKKQQVMLFLNRRGYAQLAVCKKCGYKISCSNCTVWLTYHKKKNVLLCHHCSYQSKLPEKCSNCQSEQSLSLCGIGIERLLEEIVKLLPNAKTAIISSDQKSLGSVIDSVLKEEVNIIIGTQVIAKGHNFPKLTLVGVINADLGLENSDLRAAEKTYQLLHQVAGRSGRFNEKGTVIVQTNNPESLIIKALQQQKRDLFYEIELESRRKAKMPPFSRLIALIVCGKDQFATQKAANEITNFLHNQFSTTSQHLTLKEFEIFGPSPAAINFLNNKYRYRVLLKIHNKYSLSIKKKLKHCCNLSSNIEVTIDVDPVSFF
ncbi:primosomal protein N [Wolbachia endosymbiont of Culex quinquefasciatus JHB]|uniref:replication restart helicase PriA n=1 Tax=unclassified Wolbachia TaxID=2640676 RepID=UPI0001761EE7|nr:MULTISPECIES: primosomal protein N' [unclassified Wolbachia]EEB56163.1 primosomal protein N [Wolbachia endosymbiont of Culex quinquefasciatus JHB]CAQ54874.1 primosomal protein N [Wolbachia endosymbiont of Culex quinquefasciatus Pel]CQD09145.1 primosomal protein N [Wolbachia endosymbiont wPip_Mol of Culex molestus]